MHELNSIVIAMAANVSIFFIFMDFYLRVVDVVPVVLVALLPVLRAVVDVLPELLVAELPELLLVAVELELPLRTVDCWPEAVVVLVLVLLLPEDCTRLEVVDEPDLVAELLEDVLRVADVPVLRPVEEDVDAELREEPVLLAAVPRVLLPDVVPDVEVPRLTLPVLDELVPEPLVALEPVVVEVPLVALEPEEAEVPLVALVPEDADVPLVALLPPVAAVPLVADVLGPELRVEDVVVVLVAS